MARALAKMAVLMSLTAITLGCGSEKIGDEGVIVRGKIVKGGAPLEVSRRDVGLGAVEVHLIPADSSKESQVAQAAEDGTFEMVGAGQGIAPGTYKLAVYQQDQGPGSDLLKGKFSIEKTPISIELPADKVGDTHDLGTIELNDH